MVLVIFLVLAIISIIVMKMEFNASFIAKKFKKANCIVFGKKGTGKDLVFQKVINKRKRETYFANIPYGKKYNNISLLDVSVYPNTFQDFIEDNIQKINRVEEREKKDVYISDGGVYLPSHFDHALSKRYPSMPIYYALSRHLYNSNVHINTQALNRIWIKLREQADEYFKTIKTVRIFGLLFTKVRYFEHYEAASKNLLPMSKKMLNGHQNALKEQFDSTNGKIKDMWIVQRIKKIKYDTRYFRKVFFDKNIEKE
ncbi:MAG: hypothetical protein ACOCP4_03835 [Candidatus Woesearchaeota archaeon]|uniref:Zona occludens toxin N-terminal domain-containing protein n=1 Tax=Arfiviricetes sp. TaxID=2832556 RepID=A0AB39A3B2_9VIRU